jgi:hypothetical protein
MYGKLNEGKVTVTAALKCPFCGSEDVRPYGASNGKKRYARNNLILLPPNILREYNCNGCKPDAKKAIIKRAADGAGTGTVIKE